jgi:hypothetical protein
MMYRMISSTFSNRGATTVDHILAIVNTNKKTPLDSPRGVSIALDYSGQSIHSKGSSGQALREGTGKRTNFLFVDYILLTLPSR